MSTETKAVRDGAGFRFQQPQLEDVRSAILELGRIAIRTQGITAHEAASAAQDRCLAAIEAAVTASLAAPSAAGDGEIREGQGAPASPSGHSRAEPFGLGPQAECPSRGGLADHLRNVLSWYDRQICIHENTHRGGFIWTICDDCGAKWADDRGGFKPYVDPPAIAAARDALASADRSRNGGDAVGGSVHEGAVGRQAETPSSDSFFTRWERVIKTMSSGDRSDPAPPPPVSQTEGERPCP